MDTICTILWNPNTTSIDTTCTINRNLFEIQTRHQWIQFAQLNLTEIQTQHPLIQFAQFIETYLKSKHSINRYNMINSLKFKDDINFFEIQARSQSIQFVNLNIFEIHTQHLKTQLAQFIETFLKSKHRACVSVGA